MRMSIQVFESLANPESTHISQGKVRDICKNLGLDWYSFVGRFIKFQYWKDNVRYDRVSPEEVEASEFKINAAWIDHFVDCPGFAAELVRVGWMEEAPGNLLVSSAAARAHASHRATIQQAKKEEKAAKQAAQNSKPEPTPIKKKPELKTPLTLASIRREKVKAK